MLTGNSTLTAAVAILHAKYQHSFNCPWYYSERLQRSRWYSAN